nr:conserved hypothetical protein [Rhizobiaceae bacterium]
MGGGCRDFKAVRVIHRANGQSEANIANAAAIIVHRLVRALATEADGCTSEAALASCRDHDFHRIVRCGIGDEFLHRPFLR